MGPRLKIQASMGSGRQPTVVKEGGNPPLVNNTSPRGGVSLTPRPRVSNWSIHDFSPLFWLVANPWPRGQRQPPRREVLLRRGGFPPSLTTLGPCLSANRGSPLSLLLCPSFAFAQSSLPIPHDELGQVFIVCVLRRRASLHFMFPATKGENQLRYPNSFLSIH